MLTKTPFMRIDSRASVMADDDPTKFSGRVWLGLMFVSWEIDKRW